ncbi:hypothetical protein HMPREF0156_00185 [Bacteroidetes oral taxon 274 str. F0058]|jgi:hypothetical protein|nr:hypothetical protein HMPREF0156_00185 [Bacteroidetes oral taxon 274 str. F0058]
MTNFKQVVGFAFPPRIYTGVAKSILTAMGIVLNGIFKGFIDLYKKIDDDLSITPQVCFLEKILNDKYDNKERRIHIEEAEDTLGYFFFRVNDPPSNKFYFNKAWFVEDTRYGNAGVGFVVVLPMDISATDQMRAFINRYKLISIKYQIINK